MTFTRLLWLARSVSHAAWVVSMLATGSAFAQTQPATPPPTVDVQGTLKGFSGAVLQVTDDKGEEWKLGLGPALKTVRFSASAEPGWLAPRMWVQFTGLFDAQGVPASAIGQVRVFAPGPMDKAGVEAAFSSPKGLFTTDDPSKPKGPETTSYKVTGQIVSLRGTKLSVSAGGAVVTVDLDEQTRVSVEMNDYRLAKVGDKVTCKGKLAAEKAVYAEQLSISAAEPLSNKKK